MAHPEAVHFHHILWVSGGIFGPNQAGFLAFIFTACKTFQVNIFPQSSENQRFPQGVKYFYPISTSCHVSFSNRSCLNANQSQYPKPREKSILETGASNNSSLSTPLNQMPKIVMLGGLTLSNPYLEWEISNLCWNYIKI